MPGAVDTTYTFTATDTITSTKMNNIIDQTVMTSESCLSGGGLEVASGKLTISTNAINSSRLAANSVSSSNIVDGTIVNADINASAAIAGTKISPDFGTQNIQTTGNATTGTLYLSRQDASTEGGELQFRKAFDATTAFTVDCQGAGSSPNLRIFGTTGQVATITAAGNVGISKTNPSTLLDVNGTVTATEFAGPLTGNVTGNVTGDVTGSSGSCTGNSATASACTGNSATATTASTVSNGAITAANLDGNQSGSAPIYGCRAWGSFDVLNTTRSVFATANIASVSRNSANTTQVTFPTATQMQDGSYVVTGCYQNNDSPALFATFDHQTTGFKIRHETESSPAKRIQFMVIR